MASLTIKLRVDPTTGKKDVIIDYHSDADALPIEHEQEHRRLVEKLIEGGVLKASEIGQIVVSREQETGPATAEPATGTPQDERIAEKQK